MKKLFAYILFSFLSSSLVFSQGFWSQKSSLGGNARSSGIGMATSTKGYITCGFLGGVDHFKDMWEYDPNNNTWTQKSDFPGLKRRWLIGFTINDKVYVGLGAFMISGSYYNYYTDFYEFDPTTNTWTSKANFPGTPRAAAFSFALNGIGYVGGGAGVSGVLNDMWAYNPITNTWTQKNNIGCGPRTSCVSFTIGDYGYIGTGDNGTSNVLNDFWQYNPENDSWTQKSQFPGAIRWYASGFSLGNYGYLGAGIQGSNCYDNFWQYDPNTNLWTQIASLTGGPRYQASSFNINNIAYIGTGILSNSTYTNQLWAYTPSWYGISDYLNDETDFSTFPNPVTDMLDISFSKQNEFREISIYDNSGRLVLQKQVIYNQNEMSIQCTFLAKGKYFIRVTGNEKVMVKTIVKL